jgi:hypothetical protein
VPRSREHRRMAIANSIEIAKSPAVVFAYLGLERGA